MLITASGGGKLRHMRAHVQDLIRLLESAGTRDRTGMGKWNLLEKYVEKTHRWTRRSLEHRVLSGHSPCPPPVLPAL